MADPLFWSKVNKSGKGGCWLWTGYCQRFGHGWLGNKGLAHRYAWTLLRGPIPVGKCLLHHCDVPACVNPDHLYIGDRVQNMQDKMARGRHPIGEGSFHAKLTDADILEIRRLKGQLRGKAIAERFNISRNHVYQIQAGLHWKHLQDKTP